MNAVRLYELQIDALKYLIQTFPHHQNKYRKQLEELLEPEDKPKQKKKLTVAHNKATQTIQSDKKKKKKDPNNLYKKFTIVTKNPNAF